MEMAAGRVREEDLLVYIKNTNAGKQNRCWNVFRNIRFT
jgi:hypothetical protein